MYQESFQATTTDSEKEPSPSAYRGCTWIPDDIDEAYRVTACGEGWVHIRRKIQGEGIDYIGAYRA